MKLTFPPSRNVRKFIAAAALALGAIGCGGGGDGGGGAGTGGATCDVPKLFVTKNCAIAGCHMGGTAAAAAFDMTVAGWDKAMVGKAPPGGGPTGTPSKCGPPMTKVYLSGTPATGLFIDKLTATPGCGERMPNLPGNMELSAADLACVQTWANALTMP